MSTIRKVCPLVVATLLLIIAETITAIDSNSTDRDLLDDRIVGGTPALQGEFPSFAWVKKGCGGTLIATNLILSAAHCADAYHESGAVWIGGMKQYQGEKIAIDSIYEHPDYDSWDSFKNDIMIVKLACSSRAPLQLLNFKASNPADRSDVVTAGFGTTSSGGTSSRILLKVTVRVVSHNTCRRQYRVNGDRIYKKAHICAGIRTGGKDSCQGDSGGPLIATKDNSQVGIVSWGLGCAEPKFPGIYTRISSYQEFIETMISEHSNSTQYCTP